jgi:signal transduction histidine kinase
LQLIIEMYMRGLSKIYVVSIVLTLIAMVGCTKCQQPAATGDYANADGYTRADSLVSALGDAREFPRLLKVTDSLERTGELPQVRAIFYRTIAYNLLGLQRKSLSQYYQLTNMDVKKLNTRADVECYIYSYKDYVRLLCDMRRYDRALREAYNADRKLRAAGHESFVDHHDIAQIIGESQLCLGQDAEADKSFQESLEGIKTRLATHGDPLDLRECQKTMNAIATAYMRCRKVDKAAPWIAREESLYAEALKHPHADSIYLDEMKAEITYLRAMLAHAQGRPADAEKAFADYLSTQSAKQLGHVINSCRYLMATGRFAEAARNMSKLDAFMAENGYQPDLENIGRFMIPKFHVNLLAGHRDSALRVATQIAAAYDTALVSQKKIDADLISTIYDTEGKERQIAEQRAKLSQQRLIWGAVVMFIILVFFHIYAVQRRKAYLKLDAKNRELDATNRELLLANERAEESSRMKTQFIQQISHEVRTPLNVLSGFSQVLATPDINLDGGQLQDISKKIVENSERITHLVDKMLDLSMINSNADIECLDTVTPADIAREAVEKSGIQKARHLDFQLQVSAEVEGTVFRTNRKAAVKALVLLLDNAIKFTHPVAFQRRHAKLQKAHATLSVSVSPQHIFFVVEDTGIGIPPEQAENIFTEFVQLDEYSDGTGIGLSIARSFARHMNGDVVLDTSYTGGSRFVLTLGA